MSKDELSYTGRPTHDIVKDHLQNVGRYGVDGHSPVASLTNLKLNGSADHSSNDPPATPLLSRTNLPIAHSTPPSSLTHESVEIINSPTSSFIVPSPDRPRGSNARVSTSTRRQASNVVSEDHEDWSEENLDERSFAEAALGDMDKKAGPIAQHSSESSHSQTTSHSTALSPDPISLFSPPRSRSPHWQHPIVCSPTSSVLTPISSPAKFRDSPNYPPLNTSPILGPSREIPPPHQLSSPVPADVLQAIAEEQAAERTRYSLRTRNARQLKPYEFDKMLYKRQMRSNPDAIVKVVSPPRPVRRQRSTSAGVPDGSSGAEDEYQAGDEGDEEESQFQGRWKGKERAVEVGPDAMEVDGGSGQSSVWLPEALQEAFSSDDDDAPLGGVMAANKTQRKGKERQPRRPKPFPLKKKDFRRPSPPASTLVRTCSTCTYAFIYV